MTTHIPQPPATETAPDAIRCAPVLSAAHVSAAGSIEATLAELARVSAHRCNLQERLEAVFEERWSR